MPEKSVCNPITCCMLSMSAWEEEEVRARDVGSCGRSCSARRKG
jgi:hypothetical protein